MTAEVHLVLQPLLARLRHSDNLNAFLAFVLRCLHALADISLISIIHVAGAAASMPGALWVPAGTASHRMRGSATHHGQALYKGGQHANISGDAAQASSILL